MKITFMGAGSSVFAKNVLEAINNGSTYEEVERIAKGE